MASQIFMLLAQTPSYVKCLAAPAAQQVLMSSLVWIEKPALQLSLIVSFASTKTNIYWTIGAEKFANPLLSTCQLLHICEISRKAENLLF